MSMISRYRKKGGFLQLVQLLESCTEEKREKLIGMIEMEDARWADAVKEKVLEIESVVDWPEDVLREIFSEVPNRFIGAAIYGFPEEYQEKVFKLLSRKDQLEVNEIYESKEPSDGEVYSGFGKVLEVVRRLSKERRIRFENFAPEYEIADGIEEIIESGAKPVGEIRHNGKEVDVDKVLQSQPQHGEVVASAQSAMQKASEAEEILKKIATGLRSENESLKNEVRVLKKKLDEIKKLVA